MIRHFFHLIILLFVLILLHACSAGGGETGTGVTKNSSVSVGVITGFGSVFVNGIEYETSTNTSFNIDGNSNGLESQLAVGMLVTISGNVDANGITGAASSITFEKNVEGLVISNTPAVPPATNGSLNVLGQNIIVDGETVFESKIAMVNSIDKILPNHIVQVSGFSNGDGNIYATRVELKSTVYKVGEEIEIKGLATNVGSSSFQIGSMTINYSQNALKGFTGDLKENDYVAAKSEVALENGIFIAKEIEFKDEINKLGENRENQEIEFEGVVSELNTVDNTFILNTEKLIFSDQTSYENGSISNFQNGVKVKIEGYFNKSGEIIIEKVKFKETSLTSYKGKIEAINANDKIITISGVDIKVNSLTRLKDDRDNDDETYNQQYFNFGRLIVGDYVEVNAFNEGGVLIARKLERKNDESDENEGDETQSEADEKAEPEIEEETQEIEHSLNGIITED